MKLTVEMVVSKKKNFTAWNKFILIKPTDKTTAAILAKSLEANVKLG